MVSLAGVVTLYAVAIVVIGPPMYPPELRASFLARPWGIYSHAFFGAVAMILGPFQFHPGLRRNRVRHRTLGKGYVAASLLAGMAGLYMAPYSFGGIVTHLGFGGLAVSLLTATGMAYWSIKHRRVAEHREWMIRSYALIYAAVALRILTPLLMVATQGNFALTYRTVSWLCWVPNVLLAELIVRRSRPSAVPLLAGAWGSR